MKYLPSPTEEIRSFMIVLIKRFRQSHWQYGIDHCMRVIELCDKMDYSAHRRNEVKKIKPDAPKNEG